MAHPVIVLHRDKRPGRAVSVFSGFSTVLLLLCWSPRIAGQPLEPVAEEKVKAAYLYRFAEYVRWPARAFEGPTAPLVFAVAGDSAIAAELRTVTADRSVHGRPVSVRELAAGESVAGVHVLFVAGGSIEQLPRLRSAARSQSALLVTESPGALALGSVINFIPVERRIRFEVSLAAARKSNIRLSSQLLAVAERVEQGMQ